MSSSVCWSSGLLLSLVLMLPAPAAAQDTPADDYAACLRKDGEACSRVARHYLPEGPDAPVDREKAEHFLRQGCDAGGTSSCTELASLYAGKYGGPVDGARAAALYEQACDRGDSMGCFFGGRLYEGGVGIPADVSKAAALYVHGCGSEPLEYPCVGLAPMLLDGRGIAADAPRAVAMLEKTCAIADGTACARLAEARRDGRGGPADADAAQKLFVKACGHGSAVGCRGACDAGDAASCRYGARHYDTADGVALDNTAANAMYERAIRLYDASCTGGDTAACDALRKLYWEVRLFVFADDALAQRFYVRECTHEGTACFEAARSVERAGGDRARVLDLNREGCEGGHIESCERAAELDPPRRPYYRERISEFRQYQER